MLKFIALLTPVYVPFFWFLVLLYNSKTNKARWFLSLFMFIATILYLGHSFYFYKEFEIFTWYDSIYSLASLLVYPMFYSYLRLLTADTKIEFKLYKHFIPAILCSIVLLSISLFMNIDDRKEYFNYYTNSFLYVSDQSSLLIHLKKYTYLFSRVIFSIQIIYYTILSLKTLHLHSKNIKKLYSSISNKELLWVKKLIVVYSATSVFSFLINILGKEMFLANPELLLIPSSIFSTLIFLIGFLGNMQKQVISEIDFDKKNDKIVNESFNSIDRDLVIKNMNDIIVNNKLYLDSDLKIWDLCLVLNVDRINLTKIIEEEYKTNFNNLINKYRVQEAKSLLATNKDMNLSEVYKKSGFESLQEFIKAYRKIEGISPFIKLRLKSND